MTSASQHPVQPAAPPNSSATIIRILLFVVLGYMIFCLAYDYLYVFKTHKEKFEELQVVIGNEVARSATDRTDKGPVGPQEVQEIMGFAPAVPLEEKGHYFHERYVYHRGLPFLTRNVDVYYKQFPGDKTPGIVGVAYAEEDVEETIPKAPVEPNKIEDEPATEDDKGGKKKKTDEPTTDEETGKKKKTDEPTTDEVTDPSTTNNKKGKKKTETPDEPTDEPKPEVKPEEKKPVDEPKPEEPKVEEPKTDEPKTDEPKTDEPKTDEPKVEEPNPDETKE
jgi:hypothetical protein